MRLQPDRCVALHQGQVCYQEVRISWQLEQAGDYCLHVSVQATPLKCWQQQKGEPGSLLYDVQSDKNIRFYIKPSDASRIVLQQTFKIAWVYSKSQKQYSTWRLF